MEIVVLRSLILIGRRDETKRPFRNAFAECKEKKKEKKNEKRKEILSRYCKIDRKFKREIYRLYSLEWNERKFRRIASEGDSSREP